jgi:hypothetical protein
LNGLARLKQIFARLSPTSLKYVTNRKPAGDRVILGKVATQATLHAEPQRGFIRTIVIRMDRFFTGIGGECFQMSALQMAFGMSAVSKEVNRTRITRS